MTIMSKIKSTTPWLVTLIAVLSLVATFFTGGVTSETFTKKNGDEIKITFTVPAEETVLKLIDKCKLEKLGDLCPIHFGADAELTKKGTEVTPIPAEKPDVDVDAVVPVEVKPVIAKPEIAKPIKVKTEVKESEIEGKPINSFRIC